MLAPVLVLWAPFISCVRYHDYPLWSPEIQLCLAAIAAMGVVIGIAAAWRPQTLGPLLLGTLILFYLDLQFNVNAKVGALAPLAQQPTIVMIGAPALAVALVLSIAWLLRRHLATIIAAGFGVVVVTTIALPVETVRTSTLVRELPGPGRDDLPPVVHIVLDEQIASRVCLAMCRGRTRCAAS